MIFWMMKQKHIAFELKQKVSSKVNDANNFGLFFLVFALVTVSFFRFLGVSTTAGDQQRSGSNSQSVQYRFNGHGWPIIGCNPLVVPPR